MAINPRSKQIAAPVESNWPFGTKNYILFAVALVVIVIGFFLLSQGDTTWTAFFLVLGFCAIMPWAIYAKPGGGTAEPGETDQSESA